MRSISRPISSVLPLAEETPPLKALSSIDGGLVLATLLLGAIGLATVHSASSELALDYLPRQAAWVAAGLVLMVVVSLLTPAPDKATQDMIDEVRIPKGQTILGSTH